MPNPVTRSDLHEPTFPISEINVAPGVTVSDLQKRQIAIVLDMFGARGTLGKLEDNFSKDAVYEDLFATCKDREEVAGQLLHLPDVCSSARTLSNTLLSATPTTTSTGSRASVTCTELALSVKHVFEFKAPLPKGARSVEMNSTLMIYSAEEEGKIVRLQDRPSDQIPDNAVLSLLRKFNAVAVPKVAPGPQTEVEDADKLLKKQQ